MSDQPLKHGAQHTPLAPDGIRYAVWHAWLSGDRDTDEPLIVEDNIWRPPVSEDMDGYWFRRVMIAAGVASSSGSVTIDIQNETQAVSLLTGAVTLASGSQYANESSKIDLDEEKFLTEGDILRFDCTGAGTGVKGLKVVCVFW